MARGPQTHNRFVLETSQAVCEKGVLRQIVVEAQDGYAVLRLRGRKGGFSIPWNAVYHLAAAKAAERELRARKAEIWL